MKRFFTMTWISLVVVASVVGYGPASAAPNNSDNPITVYTAKKIITMEPGFPTASAVAVRDGRIVDVGSLETLKPWLKHNRHVIDDSFEDKVLTPGLVEPHVHPWLVAFLTSFHIIAPDEWHLPTGDFQAVTDPNSYMSRLKATVSQLDDPDTPFVTWGYDPRFHGQIWRERLDDLFGDRPVILWHRSFHEIYANTAGLALLGVRSAENIPGGNASDFEKGHLYESHLFGVLTRGEGLTFFRKHVAAGMNNFIAMMRQSGVTTAADMAAGAIGIENEWATLQPIETNEEPFRMLLVPAASALSQAAGEDGDVLAEAKAWQEKYRSHRLWVPDQVKLFADGAFYSQLMKLGPPGYMDGHKGQWIDPPETTRKWAKTFWDANWQIHIHANGDEGIGMALDMLKSLEREYPRPDHRFTFEHFGYATPEQVKETAKLGALVSLQPYYVYVLADKYAKVGMG